jgi:serine/threonine protein kinase
MPSSPLSPGAKFADRYILKRRLGLGRLGEVWLADDTRLEMDVSLKFFDAIENRELLETAARRCMKVMHPHIVRVYDFTGDDQRCALVMEYLEGGSLARKLKEQESGCFEPAAIQEWMKQLWSALAELHEQNLSHGNLNLANLGIAGTGELKILEAGFFDIRSAALNPDQTFSFLPCLTPQILSGKKPGPMDDSYAAGACAYELLTGKPVFLGANLPQQIQEREVTPVALRRAEIGVGVQPVPQEWEQWIARCLSKSAYDRPESREMRDTLRDAPPVNTITEEEAAAATRQANSPAAKLGAAKEKLCSLPQQAWIGLGAAAAAAVFYFVSWQPAQKALTEMDAAFDDLKRKTISESEPPATLVIAWKEFQEKFDTPIAYSDEDAEMLDDAADFQIAQQKAADDAERARKAEAERLAEEREEKLEKLAKTLEDKVSAGLAAFSDKTVPASENLAGWQKILGDYDERLKDFKEGDDIPAAIKVLRKSIDEQIAVWTGEQKRQESDYASYLQKLSNSLDEATRIVSIPDKGASPKLTELESLIKALPVTPMTTQNSHTELLGKLTALQTDWKTKAMDEAPKEPLALAALFAGTAYANLPEDKLKALLPKVYQSLAVGVEPKDDADRKKLHEAIIKKQTAAGGIPTGVLALEDLTKAEIPIPKDEKELTDFVTSLMPKSTSSAKKRYSSSKKKAEEEEPGFWRGVGNGFSNAGKKVGGLFSGGDDKSKAKSKGKK